MALSLMVAPRRRSPDSQDTLGLLPRDLLGGEPPVQVLPSRVKVRPSSWFMLGSESATALLSSRKAAEFLRDSASALLELRDVNAGTSPIQAERRARARESIRGCRAPPLQQIRTPR